MKPKPQHGDPAGDSFLAVQQLARLSGGDVQELLTLYVLEALLSRVASSDQRLNYVLKGGVLLATFDLRRPTKDIDLQATAVPNDVETVVAQIRTIAAIGLDDGVVFDLDSISGQSIQDEDAYSGVRVRVVGTIGRSRLTIGIDVSFGDPIWPNPEEIVLPRLLNLGQQPLSLLGYPLPMVIAEKTVTAIQRGTANTRWRDYADILTISRNHSFNKDDLLGALDAVAQHRQTALAPLLPALASMPDLVQAKWAQWRRRQAYGNVLPELFADVLEQVAAFVDPVLRQQPDDDLWDHVTNQWVQRTP